MDSMRRLAGIRLAMRLPVLAVMVATGRDLSAAGLEAGTGRADITDDAAGPVHDRLQAKALVLRDGATTLAIVTVDAVAIGGIGPIGDGYLPEVRSRAEKELGIPPGNLLVAASHCHGKARPDAAGRTLEALHEAWRGLVPVDAGSGVGREDRIQENRRLLLRGGGEADVRHAYSLPPGEEVVGVGPIDPAIGVLRLDRKDGRTLAVVYDFACHPIQGVPDGGNTADLVGFASKVIEDGLEGATALFLQGSAGDINPVRYKDVAQPRDAEPLGSRLGLAALEAARAIRCRGDAGLKVLRETLRLPRADLAGRIARMEADRTRIVDSIQGTTLDLETFLPLYVKYRLGGDFPSAASHRYLQEKALGRGDLDRLDAENRRSLDLYIANIRRMEELTRVTTNLALLRMHQAQNLAAPERTVAADILALRVGDFALVSFPGELTAAVGLALKGRSPHEKTFLATCANGYLYYAPTAEQLRNPGGAQEDCDCLLAPEWEEVYRSAALRLLGGL